MIDDFSIPSFWSPAAVKPRVLTPLVFLRVQASKLGQETRGLLLSEVTTTTVNKNEEPNANKDEEFKLTRKPTGEVIHSLDVIAPALNNYRQRFVVVHHSPDMVYPASMETLDGVVTAYTEEEFQEALRKTLSSPAIVSIMQSLIARSNEASSIDTTPSEQQAADLDVQQVAL